MLHVTDYKFLSREKNITVIRTCLGRSLARSSIGARKMSEDAVPTVLVRNKVLNLCRSSLSGKAGGNFVDYLDVHLQLT